MRLGGKDIELKPDTIAWKLFGKKNSVRMRFRHRYEVDPGFIEQFEAAGLIFSGKAPNQPIMQILEIPSKILAIPIKLHFVVLHFFHLR